MSEQEEAWTPEDLERAREQITEWEKRRARECARAGVVMDAAVWRQALVETQAKANVNRRAFAEARAEVERLESFMRSLRAEVAQRDQIIERLQRHSAEALTDMGERCTSLRAEVERLRAERFNDNAAMSMELLKFRERVRELEAALRSARQYHIAGDNHSCRRYLGDDMRRHQAGSWPDCGTCSEVRAIDRALASTPKEET